MHTILLERVVILKKIIVGTVFLILIITVYFVVIEKKSEEKIEIALVKSMEGTQKEKKKIEELLTRASQELNNKGYEQIGLSYSPDDRTISVQVQDEEFFKKNRSIVENIVLNVAKEVELQDVNVDFRVLENYIKINQEQQKLNESLSEASKVISDLLKEQGLNIYLISLHPKKEIIIEGTSGDLANKDEIEKMVAKTVLSKTNMNFTVKIQKKSKVETRDQNWQPVFSSINEETKKEFKEYRGFAYSFHPEPLQIIIKTNLEKPKWYWNSNQKVSEITIYVDKIIELKTEELSIEEIPYEIIIRDKNDKKIN